MEIESCYRCDGTANYESTRDRKLLLRKSEIERMSSKLNEAGTTIVPLSLYSKEPFVKAKGLNKDCFYHVASFQDCE